MELVQRYVSAVQRYLPEEQQAAIGRELSADIADKIAHQAEEAGRTLSDSEIATLLQQWGHPRLVASQYVPPLPLVSSELMPLYWQVLKLVLALLFVWQVLGASMALLQAEQLRPIQFLLQLTVGFFDEAATAFMVITLIFYAQQFGGPLLGWAQQTKWQVTDLPPAERPWQQMRLSDSITELATTGFLLLLFWYPLWMPAETLAGLRVVPGDVVMQQRPVITVLLLLSLAFSIWCWFRPYWQQATLWVNLVLNLAFICVLAWLAGLDAIVVGTTQPLPELLELSDINRVLKHSAWLVGLYLLYEAGRDLYRLRQLKKPASAG
ncbi:hypothetical protein [Rheinheimera sp. 4Y26]|uniref:hypothetical protein n=1 Tax=Rheinheimera sp. 4Y26 TaxID=2977811 RepID=UPI0021B0BED4|nr:hypothetical protein [Rheinheimera sp. 4Y26]MCT6698284.1 hypothetical protein [Rheinheimera sp. 4Y26]